MKWNLEKYATDFKIVFILVSTIGTYYWLLEVFSNSLWFPSSTEKYKEQ